MKVTQPDLFSSPAKRARARAESGMARATQKAERVSAGWHSKALEAVRLFANSNTTFMAEDVRAAFFTPASVDGRAWGAVLREAERLGYIARDGYAPANSSNRSPKRRWRSKLRR